MKVLLKVRISAEQNRDATNGIHWNSFACMKKISVKTLVVIGFALANLVCNGQQDPVSVQLVTSDITNFWIAFDSAGMKANPDALQKFYLDKGSKGLSGFIRGRIQNAENLSKTILRYPKYYASIRDASLTIATMEPQIEQAFAKFNDMYDDATFPPVYFVVGAMNSGGTTSGDGILIAAEMYGLTDITPTAELTSWHKTVLKKVVDIPYIVAHELIHIQQPVLPGNNLLEACLREGSADFVSELISGKHINNHIHEFADPREKELWLEFKEVMYGNKKDGWLYSQAPGRPNDLGYWIGYKIAKAYYDQAPDKKRAIKEIIRMRNGRKFLEDSGYEKKFE